MGRANPSDIRDALLKKAQSIGVTIDLPDQVPAHAQIQVALAKIQKKMTEESQSSKVRVWSRSEYRGGRQ